MVVVMCTYINKFSNKVEKRERQIEKLFELFYGQRTTGNVSTQVYIFLFPRIGLAEWHTHTLYIIAQV